MYQLQQFARQNPQWSLDELVEVANQLLPQYLPDQGSDSRLQDTVNARLVRHYTTQGLLDRPLKQGREARYLYRHLLQLLLLRRLLAEGYSSSSLGQALQKSNQDLESLLQGGAQLTMEAANPALAFLAKVRDRGLGPPSQRTMAPPASPPVPSSPPSRDEASRPSTASQPPSHLPTLPTEDSRFAGSAIPRSAPSNPREVNPSLETSAPEAFQEEVSLDPPDELSALFEADCELSIDQNAIDQRPVEPDSDLEQEVFDCDDFDSSLLEPDALDDFDFDFEAFEGEELPDHLENSTFSPAPDRASRPSAPVPPDTTLWSRHTLLEGLELHIREDFIYPSTPQERATLLQLIDQWLRSLAANPPSHPSPSNPSNRRSPP